VSEMAPLFPDRATQDRFFAELRELIERFPSIGGRMAATFAADPSADWAQPVEGHHAVFDPASPMLCDGLVVIVSHRNLDGFEEMSVIRQRESSHYHDLGLLTAAIGSIS
jgi:hypothetical protein